MDAQRTHGGRRTHRSDFREIPTTLTLAAFEKIGEDIRLWDHSCLPQAHPSNLNTTCESFHRFQAMDALGEPQFTAAIIQPRSAHEKLKLGLTSLQLL